MGAGCSSSAPMDTASSGAAAPIGPTRRPGHVFLSYHPPDTGDQRTEGGDGAAVRVRDWLASRGYIQQRPSTSSSAAPGVLVVGKPYVTLRNGTIKLRRNQRVRVTAPGVVLDGVSFLMDQPGGPGGGGSHRQLGGGGGGAGGAEAGFGGAYVTDRGMVELTGAAVGLRIMRTKLYNHAPHAALHLVDGATAALLDCDLESPLGAGAVVSGAGSVFIASGCCLKRCAGPCLLLEGGAAAQLSASSVLDSERHNGVAAGGGARLRADRCVVSGSQAGINLYAGASAELVGCEVSGNVLAGAEVREPGSVLLAADTKFARNGQVALSYNGQAGVLVTERATARLATCSADGNKLSGIVVWGAGTAAAAVDCKLLQNAGAGLALRDGAAAELRRCTVKLNRAGGAEVAGKGSVLTTDRESVVDPKPTLVAGGVHAFLQEDKGRKGRG
ncbi:hypothetical protein GPECTOR_5g4 [Gonium pectorale]|uniref:Right handed beta helix domain-containing protein n=1 Tax=Gonium pectorale TaxID=33097 RepID=A0A150GWY4_GONPE|nr:hypothetical protein GPECTOR_5g4 [Gonium pectorale]|eukprot:KXZ54315.1 hypothetical protein GPECTOR_5g4 [Gonium pectorale]